MLPEQNPGKGPQAFSGTKVDYLYPADNSGGSGPSKKEELTAEQIELLRAGIRRSNMEKFAATLQVLDNASPEYKTNVEFQEVIQQEYETMLMQGIGETLKYHKKQVKNKKNGYPYESRQGEYTIDAINDIATTLKETDTIKSPEAKLWLKRIEQDSSWMAADFLVTVENSASLFASFDVVQQLQVLKIQNRPMIEGEDLEDHNAAVLEEPDLNLTPAEQNLANGNKIGIKIPADYNKSRFTRPNEQANYSPGETIGLRDLALVMRASSFEARMKIAAISQVDYRLATESEQLGSTFMGDNLSKDDFDFYKQIFWRTSGGVVDGVYEGKGTILAPDVVSSKREKKEAEAYLEALLTTNAVERFDEIKKLDGAEKVNATSALITEVKTAALDRITNWRTREKKDIVSAMASLVTKQGLLQDFAFMHAYRYCFRGIWNVDENGRPRIKRDGNGNITSDQLNEWESGSIYSWSGDIYSLYYLHRHHTYNKLANADTVLLEATSKAGRAEMARYPLDKTPKYESDMSREPDTFLKDQWNFLFSKDPIYQKQRRDMGYEDIPDVIANKLKSWATRYVTPFTVRYLEDLDKRDAIPSNANYELTFPWFMPEGNSVANFFEAVTASEGKLNTGAKSVMQQIIEGTKLYNINWKNTNYENQPVDRWHVDNDQASNVFRLLIEDFDTQKDPVYTKVAGSPGTGGIKLLNKRLRLWSRDSAQAQPEFFEIAFVPMFITLAEADKHGIFGAGAWSPTNSKEDIESNMTAVNRFVRQMAYWKRAFKWMPGDRPSGNLKPSSPDGLKYGNTMALMCEFFEVVMMRIAKASAEESASLAIGNYDKTIKRVNQFAFMKKGRFKEKLNEAASLRK